MNRRPRIPYMPEELAFVEARKTWPRAQIHSAFCFMFDRTDVTAEDIRTLCNRKGWAAGPEGRSRNKGKFTVLNADQAAWMHANATLPLADIATAFRQSFPDAPATEAQLLAFRKRQRINSGRTGRFEKGNPSHNKGRKGYCPPGSQKGHFKKGQTPHTFKGAGHESIDPKDGYVWLIVAETNPHTGAATRRVMKHRWLWEQANGPVPEGYALKCLDGDRTNTDPSNWEPVKRGVLSRLNGGPRKKRLSYDAAPPELKPTVMAIAKVQQAVHELRKGAR